MTHRNNFDLITFGRVKNPKSVNPQFPRSDGIWPKLLSLSGADVGIHFQVAHNPRHDDAPIVHVEVSDILLGAFRQRDSISHSGIVSEKVTSLKRVVGQAENA